MPENNGFLPEINGKVQCPTDVPGETYLITNNQGKISILRRFGFFLVYWQNGNYNTSNRMLMLYYLLTYFGAGAIGGLAIAIKEIFKDESYSDDVDDLVEACFVGIFLGIAPSCWIYLLKEINTYLPIILFSTNKLENTVIYKKLEFSKNPEVEYSDGYLNEDHADIEDDLVKETKRNTKTHWWLVKHGPLLGMILSVTTCVFLLTVSVFWDLSDALISKSPVALKHFKKDLPTFMACVLYPIPSYVSLWFCIFFLEWLRRIYASLRKYIRTIKNSNHNEENKFNIKLNEESKEELEKICCMLKELKKVFMQVNKKIFQITLVFSFTLFITLGVFCCCKIIETHTNFVYMFPLSLIMGHLYFVCKWSNDLMGEFREIIEVLNQIDEVDVADLRRELNELPPQVCAFGGFGVDYSMMTAIIAFMLSIISISGMIWPDLKEEDQCYTFQDNGGDWNYTMCIKQICYKYHDVNDGWNQTICGMDKIEDISFNNRTFSLIEDSVTT